MLNKVLLIFYDELISGTDSVKCSAGESFTLWLPLLRCDPDPAQQGPEGCGEQDGQITPDYRQPSDQR